MQVAPARIEPSQSIKEKTAALEDAVAKRDPASITQELRAAEFDAWENHEVIHKLHLLLLIICWYVTSNYSLFGNNIRQQTATTNGF